MEKSKLKFYVQVKKKYLCIWEPRILFIDFDKKVLHLNSYSTDK